MLNKYIWNLYLQSGGADTVEMFRRNLSEKITSEYVDEITRMRKYFCVMEELAEDEGNQIRDFIHLINELEEDNDEIDLGDELDVEIEDGNETTLLDSYFTMMAQECCTPQDTVFSFLNNIAFHSTDLASLYPDCFIPYYFRFNFNVLQKIAEEFEIELPAVPLKKDYKGRFYYYGEISKSLLNFAKQNELSNYELYAFLYEFAPHYLGGIDCYIVKELPAPRSAFFIGADQNDEALADNPSEIIEYSGAPKAPVRY